ETSGVGFNASVSSCAWSVSNTNSWIINISPTSGTGTGIVSYTVSPNLSGSPRQGVFTIGGAPVIVNQAGLACSFALSATNFSHGAGAEAGLVSVTTGTGCIWYIFNTNAWISLAGWNGQNSGGAAYLVEGNRTIEP